MTKVLCIGYYDKFSRFFLYVKKEFCSENQNVSITILSTYISGFLYSFLRLQSSSWISAKAWWKASKSRKTYLQLLAKNTTYKGFDIEKLLANHRQPRNSLRCQAMAYIDILEKKVNDADYLLMIGDLRLPFEIAKQWANKKNIPTFFIEQGPYATTIVDKKGVNANASIRGFLPSKNEDIVKQKFVEKCIHRQRPQKYFRSPLYRGLDYTLEFLLMKTAVFPPDLKVHHPIFSQKKHKKTTDIQIDIYENVFLLIAQVPFDVNMTHHSPHYKNHADILRDVHQSLPKNSALIVREHPIFAGKYEKKFYDYIQQHESVFVDNTTLLSSVLTKADVVIVNNSTVGLEAIAQQKSVVVLANSYYDSSEICLKMTQREELPKLLQKALNFQPDKHQVTDFLFQFFTHQAVEGFVTDKNLKAAKGVYQYIFNTHQS